MAGTAAQMTRSVVIITCHADHALAHPAKQMYDPLQQRTTPLSHTLMFQVPTVLFVCTGNIYRSRFAEALFNHHAESSGLGWCAFSRGLMPGATDVAGLSPHAEKALETHGIAPHHTAATKTALTGEDLAMAHIIIALSENEHRPMVSRQFPDWLDQFNFWQVEDVDLCKPEDAVRTIEQEVMTLLGDLTTAGKD